MIQKTFTRKGPKFIKDWQHFINFEDISQLHDLKSIIIHDKLEAKENNIQKFHHFTIPNNISVSATISRGQSNTVYKYLEDNNSFNINEFTCPDSECQAIYGQPWYNIRIYDSKGVLKYNNSSDGNWNNLIYGEYKIVSTFNSGAQKRWRYHQSSTWSSWWVYGPWVWINSDVVGWQTSGIFNMRYSYRVYNFTFKGQTRIELHPSTWTGRLEIWSANYVERFANVTSSANGQTVIINHDFGLDFTDCIVRVWNQHQYHTFEDPKVVDNDITDRFDLIIYSENDIHTQENIIDITTSNPEESVKLAHINCNKCTRWWFQNKEILQNYVKENTIQCPECNDYNIKATILDENVRWVFDHPTSIVDDFYRTLVTVYSQLDTENPIPLPIVEAKFIADEITGMGPLIVNFENESHSSFDTFSWNFGDPDSGVNNTSDLENPSHTFSNIDDYDITLTASNAMDSDIKIRYNYIRVTAILPAPTAGIFVTPLTGVKPLTISLGSTSAGVIDSYEWDFDDGRTSNYENPPNIIYNFSGTYNISLTVTGPGGVDTTTTAIEVSPIAEPISDFQIIGDITGDVPLSIEFSNQSSGLIDTYHWVFGDGDNSDEENPIHIYEIEGTYSVSLTIIGPGGTDIKTLVDCVIALPL
jgi:PKD repeat protein